ncbi:stage III sporulation protein AA [Bacillus nitroreducens]
MKEIIEVLPKSIASLLVKYTPERTENMEEIRIRVSRPLETIENGRPIYHNYHVTGEDAIQLLNKLGQYSIYTLEEELKRGYVTIQGGHRVGLAGKVITENGRVKAIRDVTSFNIRIAKQKIGVATPLAPYLFDSYWKNTIIIGPPQTGKTTLLRDLARMISSGIETRQIPAMKVGIVDERSEIAGCVKGVPQATLGPRVDVLDACPKAEGMMMMIRSMSPDVLIVDEIGREEDSQAIMEAVNAGVSLIVTAHGHQVSDLMKRPSLEKVIKAGVIERYVELSRTKGPGTIRNILGPNGKHLLPKVSVT